MKTPISKAYRGKDHIGWKKTVGGHEWFLGYGTSPADEAKAIFLAEVLEAKWRLMKASGGVELSQTDLEDAKALIASQPRWVSAWHEMVAPGPGPVPTPVPPAPAATAPVSNVVALRPAANSDNDSTSMIADPHGISGGGLKAPARSALSLGGGR